MCSAGRSGTGEWEWEGRKVVRQFIGSLSTGMSLIQAHRSPLLLGPLTLPHKTLIQVPGATPTHLEILRKPWWFVFLSRRDLSVRSSSLVDVLKSRDVAIRVKSGITRGSFS